jgi:hypothetical protein
LYPPRKPRSTPKGRFTSIDGGYSVTFCAVREDGEALCWPNYPSSPLAPSPPGPYVDVQTGDAGHCGILQDGSAKCWSAFDGTVAQLRGQWAQIDVGSAGASSPEGCGIRPGGSVACFDIQFGAQMSAVVREDRPPPDGRYVALALSDFGEACAVRTDGTVVCWEPFAINDARQPPQGLIVRTH